MSAKIDLNNAAVTHLPNGLTVIMLEDHSFPVVSVQALYKSGSAAEVTGKTGLAHFLEHLAFRASENFPKARATELIYDAGGEWHGYTAMDQTTYFSTMPREGLDLLLRIEADRMARTTIDPAAIDAEKGAVITELHSYDNDPASVLQDAVTRTAIQAHPYGSPMAGYVSDVERLTIDDARAYYASHYAPGNAVLAIAGDFDPAQATTLVGRAFATVPARAVARPDFTTEPPQRGERRLQLAGPVDRQYFLLAYHSAAASSPDFPALLVLQQILSGTPGLNPRQSGWAGTSAIKGSALFGSTEDIATWLPATHDSFLFTISGSISTKADRAALERHIETGLASIRDHPITQPRLTAAKTAVTRTLEDDVQTTEDAAHQLAFFEGIGALDALLNMPARVAAVTAADLQRVARTYLAADQLTVGWMVPGKTVLTQSGDGNPQAAVDRPGTAANNASAGQPLLRRLPGGLPAIVQSNPLSDTATVELLLSASGSAGAHPQELAGLDAVIRSGSPQDLPRLLTQAAEAARQKGGPPEPASDDPVTRLEQMISAEIGEQSKTVPKPLAIIVSGNVQTDAALTSIERQFGRTTADEIPAVSPRLASRTSKIVRAHISKPLSQGAIGYVVEGPRPGTPEALAWRMLLYVFTHDYSGRLGRSAIADKGIVYHIYSLIRTDGRRSWATISTGVDPDKADAMEAELRAELARLVSEPPTASELDAARNHLLGRDLSAAQSNDEIAAKLAREFVETGSIRSHEQLRAQLKTITAADLAAAARSFVNGTILRVDVSAPGF